MTKDEIQFAEDLASIGKESERILDAMISLPLENNFRKDLVRATEPRVQAGLFAMLLYIYMRRERRCLRLPA